MTKHSKAPS